MNPCCMLCVLLGQGKMELALATYFATRAGFLTREFSYRHIYFDALAASPGRPFPNAISNPIPGQAWTERARGEVLGEIHAPTIHHLMVRLFPL